MKSGTSRLLSLSVVLATLVPIAPAQPAQNGPAQPAQQVQTARTDTRDRKAMRRVAILLEHGLTEHALDDQLSSEAFDSYIEAWDPLKLYFLQSDIDELAKRRNDLDDLMKAGDLSFAHRVYQLYLDRVDQRVALAEKLLDQEFDFTVDEYYVNDPEHAHFATSEAEASERWRKRVKYDLLRLRVDDHEDADARDRLRRRYRGMQRRLHRLEPDEIAQLFINSVTTCLDPHSTYMGAHSLENFQIEMRLDYQGIGALLASQDEEIVVERVFPGGPAAKDGTLKVGDHIVAVGEGDEAPLKDVAGMRLRNVVQMIRGPADTVVRLGLVSSGKKKTLRLVRGRTELDERAATKEVIEHKSGDGQTTRIGMIQLPSFYGTQGLGGETGQHSASHDVERILHEFQDQDIDVVVLDLRGNGGGYLNEAIDLAGLFIESGPVVQVRGFSGRVKVLRDQDASIAWSGPLVVLIDKFSASASEIVAAAITDYGRGLLVGDAATHGKGTVQRVLPLDVDGGSSGQLGALKLTVEKFYRISGPSTQLRGVASDVTLPSITNDSEFGEAKLPHALPFDAIDATPHQSYGRISDDVVAAVVAASRSRRAASKEFAEIERRIAAFRQARDRIRMPLQEKRYRALRAELEERKTTDPSTDPNTAKEDEKSPEQKAYHDEILAIASDYVRLLRGA